MVTPPGPRVLAQRVIAQECAALQVVLQQVLDCQVAPAGSVWAADVNWLDAQSSQQRSHLSPIFEVARADAIVTVTSVGEHAKGLEALLACDPLLPVSMFTLARALYEAALRLCWLYDPDVAPERRLVRAAAVRLAAAEGNHRGLRDFPHPSRVDLARSQEAMDGTRELLGQAGFSFKPFRPGQPYNINLTYGKITENLTFNAKAAAQRYTPGVTFLWTGGSGAAHGLVWFTRGLDPQDPRAAYAALMPLLDVADALVRSAAFYAGLDPDPYHRKTHMRRLALAQQNGDSGPFVGYKEYNSRATLNLPV